MSCFQWVVCHDWRRVARTYLALTDYESEGRAFESLRVRHLSLQVGYLTGYPASAPVSSIADRATCWQRDQDLLESLSRCHATKLSVMKLRPDSGSRRTLCSHFDDSKQMHLLELAEHSLLQGMLAERPGGQARLHEGSPTTELDRTRLRTDA